MMIIAALNLSLVGVIYISHTNFKQDLERFYIKGLNFVRKFIFWVSCPKTNSLGLKDTAFPSKCLVTPARPKGVDWLCKTSFIYSIVGFYIQIKIN